MSQTFHTKEKTVKRKYFGKHRQILELPSLIEVQQNSNDWFIKEGLKELFEEISPIKDFANRGLELYFGNYYLDVPKFDEVTAKAKNLTFEAPLKVAVTLTNTKTGKHKEQEIYLGDFPLMTDRGTFIINGIERVVVSQIIRSAGVFFTSQFLRGRKYYGAKIIPNRGTWLEVETDMNNVIWVKIDRKRKVAVTSLLRAFGYFDNATIKALFKDIDNNPNISFIDKTLEKDLAKDEAEGLKEVYKRIRPGDPASVDNARQLIHAMFFNFSRYDFGRVGRYKIDKRLNLDVPNTKKNRILRPEDLVAVITEIIRLNNTQEEADDIDHLSNRRLKAVGELIQNKFRIGLVRMERIIKDRMSVMDVNVLNPNQLINARPVISAVQEFFMSSQLSQFMDQVNPLAELEHKRRVSALGPGGLSRERAGFEVRDVHRTHYGRLCPIATPEGPNIGLVGHLASYARVNEFGFIETPYRKVKNKNGKMHVTDEVVYMDALEEERHITVPATAVLDDNSCFSREKEEVRKYGQPELEKVENIEYMDVAPNQIISIATSFIPFIEHDDGQRALMGTNMQRQAVSCIRPESPIIGTGIEALAARDSGHIIKAVGDGEVVYVDGRKISLKLAKDHKVVDYTINKFVRSNTSTCINQHAVVNKGDQVKKNEILSDGPGINQGEIALGQNLLVAYMSWEGGNYEDAILLSEDVVKDDRYTSIHIEDYTIDVRETKLGPEVITNDIPNVAEEKLKDLDESGIIRIGAEVASGDILVGKITPKGETELSAEEKLLRAIFGEKVKDVRDTSLRMEHGKQGKVVDIRTFSREKGDKLSAGVIKTVQISVAHLRKIRVGDKMAGRHGNKGVVSRIVSREDMPYLPDGRRMDIILNPLGVISRMNLGQLLETHLGLAAKKLNYMVASPALDGVDGETIKTELARAGYPQDGKLELFDGRTGEKFKEKVTIGYAYMLKLNHLVEDKIHQRSIGPYSLVTQQPLGGKAQFGGQRFGEMEVWALEAYGAAYTLQEILTIKSDDVPGRSKAYEAIIKGEPIRNINIPESFNVLIKELKSLGLDVELLKKGCDPERKPVVDADKTEA